jgi:hypothetical protein
MGMRRFRTGSNAVELALTMPVFLMFFLGIMDWGWYLFMRAQLVNATMLGCEMGAKVHPDEVIPPETVAETNIEDRFRSLGYSCTSPSLCDWTITTTRNTGYNVGEDSTVVCSANIEYTPITGYVMIPTLVYTRGDVRLEFQQ